MESLNKSKSTKIVKKSMALFGDKQDCCGCGACSAICSLHAITMEYDLEGFLYPKINRELCCECHLCQKICPLK